MKILIALLVAGCFMQSCTKPSVKAVADNGQNSPSSQNTSIDIIAGKWNWIQSDGGISYRIENPSNTGNQLQIEFNNDGTVNYYKNNVVQFSGTYSIKEITDPSSGAKQLKITQNYFGNYSEAEQQLMTIDSGNLTFTEIGADRFVHKYSRATE